MEENIEPGRALIIVDVQEDFVEGGSLAVAGGRALAERIASELLVEGHPYSHIVTTQDWHIDPGTHFSDTPDFVTSWPRHCVAETEGAEILPAIQEALERIRDPEDPYAIDQLHKGQFEDAYSGFMASDINGVPLAELLKEANIGAIDVVGIASDFCVAATAFDGVKEGFETRVLRDYTVGIIEERVQDLFEGGFAAGGVKVA